MTYLEITGDFETTKAIVIGAMVYPRNTDFRASYCLRNRWYALSAQDGRHTLASSEVRDILSASSRHELREAAVAGTKKGTVAGDLLSLIYEQWRSGNPRPSLRDALKRYQQFAIGKKYGNGEALKYSDGQLRTYFEAAAPSAHLWAAHRLLKRYKDRGKSYKTAFTPEGMPYFLGLAKNLQDFAITFVPTGTKPAKPIIQEHVLLLLPETISPIQPEIKVL